MIQSIDMLTGKEARGEYVGGDLVVFFFFCALILFLNATNSVNQVSDDCLVAVVTVS